VIVLVFGLWLVQLGRFGYGAGWGVAALALFVVVTLLGGVGGQSPKRARKLAARLAEEGDVESDALRSLLDDRLARDRQLPLSCAAGRDRRLDGLQARRPRRLRPASQ
jgi:hypothetical protein